MSNRAIDDLMMKFARLEERVKGLYTYQKWQMAILAGILIAVVAKRF